MEKGKLRVGEIWINEKKVVIPFRKDVNLANRKDWIAIDINKKTDLTVISTNHHIIRYEIND
ncbi:MAG: hypothetical protein QXR33_07385 [Candidatus Nezhaarchaeales archaeon]